MEKKPYTAAEKARIVAKGEARLGIHNFFDGTKTIPVGKAVRTIEILEHKVENAEDMFHKMYTELFAKAVANLRSSQNLRRIQ